MKKRIPSGLFGFLMIIIASPGICLAQTSGVPAPKVQASPPAANTPSLSQAARSALDNLQSARSNITRQNYPAARLDVSQAENSLKSVQGNPEVQQFEAEVAKNGSPLAKAQQELGHANYALAQNDGKTADGALQKAEGYLKSLV